MNYLFFIIANCCLDVKRSEVWTSVQETHNTLNNHHPDQSAAINVVARPSIMIWKLR
jgi:hypothetical protein